MRPPKAGKPLEDCYEAGNPVSQIESRVLCFFYPVRDRVSNGVNPDFLSISLRKMTKWGEETEKHNAHESRVDLIII